MKKINIDNNESTGERPSPSGFADVQLASLQQPSVELALHQAKDEQLLGGLGGEAVQSEMIS
jgi:hypothetical protein